MSNIRLREERQVTANNVWLFPSQMVWPENHVFVSTPSYNYTLLDYQRFFTDVNYEDGWHLWNDTKDLMKGLPPPGVDVYCLYGLGVLTPETYIYDNSFPYEDPVDIVYGDGDESVNRGSLELCKRWNGQQKQRVEVMELPEVDHLSILFNNLTLNYINEILLGSLGNATAAQEGGEEGEKGPLETHPYAGQKK